MPVFIRRDGTVIDWSPPKETRHVRCTKCGHTAPYDDWPKGRDFFQHIYISRCLNRECDNDQSPGGAAMRMFGDEHPFVFVRPEETSEDALDQTLHRASEAS